MGIASRWTRPATAPVQGWAVIDVETTGLFPSRSDRIVEIAIVALDPERRVTGSWCTLVDPGRDVGPTHIHGITGRQVRGAPKFRELASELLWLISGRVLVAHNARFDLGFLIAETQRAGITWGPVDALCTMTLASRAGLGRGLSNCCDGLGVPLERHHSALADAHAAASIFSRLWTQVPAGSPAPAPAWPKPSGRVLPRLRTDPPPSRIPVGTAALASRVGAPVDLPLEHDAALSYLDLLDKVLEDRHLTATEISDLRDLARDWGIGRDAADRLNRVYIERAWDLALRDGMITEAGMDDIRMLAELLGVPPERHRGSPVNVRATSARRAEFVGKSVCFTGQSRCTLDGVPLGRADQERLAAEAGMLVKSGVSRRLDVLVMADPDSQSGKAREARKLNVQCMVERAFWRALGVPID